MCGVVAAVSDMIDMYRDFRAFKAARRRMYGVPCPQCNVKQPKRQPTILLPGQRCKVDGYRDTRPALTQQQIEAIAP